MNFTSMRREKTLYIAVWHGNKWTRAVVSMESRVLFWLIDCGYFLRPEESTIYVPLSSEFKKLPSKVFEASIHGVVPIDKFLNETCEIENQVCMTWNDGAIHKGQNLITTSKAIYFVPIAIMSTKGNDVVLGDLYLEIPGEGTVNFIDLMELWPVFLQRNPEAYVKNLSEFYVSRRKHHACLLKPQMVPNTELPAMTLTTTLLKYRTIAESAPKLNVELDSESEDGSTVVNKETQKFRLTPSEIEEYSGMYFKEHGKEINVLNMLINKTRDLIMCERYKDRKSVGRAFSRHRARLQDNTDLLDDGRYDDFEESF
ncbi:hypothetical protein MSG28_002101 [Choristoneura fumiferana]|uniref:Uncharacterized protein n=1 Tax=Choristoneura fumiferana TaxID=7141 RepID=A0ACC0JUB1_CHOFU|nr:hypothetical protein MSG28_002101 [Choristoneura fumiferana]